MKIVLISFLYEPELGGGSSQVVFSLAHDLAAQGVSVTVITSTPQREKAIEYQDGIKIIRFFPRNLYWVNEKDQQPTYRKIFWQLLDIWNPFVYRSVRGFLEAEKPDLVHVHKLRGLSPSVWNAARANGVRALAHTCHDYELVSPEGLFSGRVGQWAAERALIMRPYQALRAGFSKQVQLVSGPSRFIIDVHSRMGFFKSSTCRVIPNSHGFNQHELITLRDSSKNGQKHPLRLLYLGRLAKQKGIDILCEAFQRSLIHYPDISLNVAGWGPQEESLQTRFGNNQQIHFHGKVFGEKKARLLKECDLLILPSTALESFGIVLIEAFAYGKPVLASRIGGIPEIVKDGETGFLFSSGDVGELANKICAIADDPANLSRMNASCFEAATQYTSEIILKKYMDFYNHLLLS